MSAPEIHIDSIRLDLRGVNPAAAQAAVASLGPELRAAVAAQVAGRGVSASSRVEHVTPPTVRVLANADATTLRAALAQQIATTIAGQLTAATPQSQKQR